MMTVQNQLCVASYVMIKLTFTTVMIEHLKGKHTVDIESEFEPKSSLTPKHIDMLVFFKNQNTVK